MNTIDIQTAQNVSIEYELATLRDRFIALLIDILIVLAGYFVIISILMNTVMDDISYGYTANIVFVFMPLLLFVLYNLFLELWLNGQTIGKRTVGIKVVRLDGREPGIGNYLMRAIFHLIDTIFSFGVMGALLISSSIHKQRLGDMTANTTLIKVKFNQRFRLEDILSIGNMEDYEITYPEVKRFSEQDMLMIKTIISRYVKYPNEAHEEVLNELVEKVKTTLDIRQTPPNKIEFLKLLIRDYIVLTR